MRRGRSVSGSASALCVLLALSACDNSGGRKAEGPARVVLVTSVRYLPRTPTRHFVASIKPRVETDQAFRVSGKVVRRPVENGQRVKAGDLLAQLDEADLRLQKEQAEAELSSARMAMEQSSADERRTQTLRKDGWTAQAALDRQKSVAEEARGRHQRALRAVELAGNALGYASLRAEADGVVTATFVEPGQIVAAGQAAVRVARAGELEAVVSLPEAFAASAGSGQASLALWSDPSKVYRARLRELGASADATSRTFAARYSIIGADAGVALGMSATLTLAGEQQDAVATLPLAALINQGSGPAVWTVEEGGKLTLVPVSVLRYEAKTALVSGGVAEGAKVAVLGVQKLDAGQRVRPVEADAQ